MPDNGNASFIPRQTPGVGRRRKSRRSLGLFGYGSYVVFGGAILASLGMFFYGQYVQSLLVDRQSELESVKNQFDSAEMQRVQEYESYLNTVNILFAQNIRLQNLFTAIEDSIAQGALMDTFTIEREDNQLLVQAEVTADSFDTALFQRSVYEEYPLLSSFSLEDVVLAGAQSEGGEQSETTTATDDTVTFSLTFNVPTDNLSDMVDQETVDDNSTEESTATSSSDGSNEDAEEEGGEEADAETVDNEAGEESAADEQSTTETNNEDDLNDGNI